MITIQLGNPLAQIAFRSDNPRALAFIPIMIVDRRKSDRIGRVLHRAYLDGAEVALRCQAGALENDFELFDFSIFEIA